MLQLANEHASIFEKLIKAYILIAESLPRFDRYQTTFQDRPEMRQILALIYYDILEFHRRTYAFFRRKAWQTLFDTLWKDFNGRFSSIIERLTRHRDLVDKEATSIDIAEARVWRARAQEELEDWERDRSVQQLNRTINWLRGENSLHMPEDDLYRFSETRLRGTCKWILRDKIMVNWMKDDEHQPVAWMKGIPGAGKTISSVCIIQELLNDSKSSVAYYFCDSNSDVKDLCSTIIRSIVIQLIQHDSSLAVHVDTNHIARGFLPTRAQPDKLVRELLETFKMSRVVIDGLDECSEANQKEILTHVLRLFTYPGIRCKTLISSRDCSIIRGALRKVPTISLSERRENVEKDVRLFIRQSLLDLRRSWHSSLIDEIEQKMLQKAAGIFLWVRLVVSELQESLSLKELTEAVDGLPEGLHKAYQKLLDRIQKRLGARHRQKAYLILHWIAGSSRTLKTYEVQNGVVLASDSGVLDDSTRLPCTIFDLCKPIIEEGPGNTVRFVHFSAKQYILHQVSGPFFTEVTANRTIIRGSAAYLFMANTLLDSSVTEAMSILSVCKGFHDLHNFVHDFWSQHIIKFATLYSTRKAEFTKEDMNLLYRFGSLRRRDAEDVPSSSTVQVPHEKLDQVAALQELPDIQDLVQRYLYFQTILRSDEYSALSVTERQGYELRHDPTILAELSQRYRGLVKVLLRGGNAEILEHIDPYDIAKFRDMHSESAFPCRYSFCSRSSNGFATAQDRETHEASHWPRIKCPIASCEFHVFGFASKQALERHNSRYHKDGSNPKKQRNRLIRKEFDVAIRKHFMEEAPLLTQAKPPKADLQQNKIDFATEYDIPTAPLKGQDSFGVEFILSDKELDMGMDASKESSISTTFRIRTKAAWMRHSTHTTLPKPRHVHCRTRLRLSNNNQ